MSFDPFGDFSTAGYLRNSLQLKDPEKIKRSEHLAFELSLPDALNFLSSQKVLNYNSILSVHQILFSDFYPWAGKDRNELVPKLAVFKGSSDNPRHTVFEQPALIRRACEYALSLAGNHDSFLQKPGEVMGLLAFAYPFLDGNGRTLLLVFMELAFRAGFAIHWGQTNKDEYLQALSREINEPAGRHLDKYLEPYIVPISRREDWPQIIGEIRGLDGLDKENVSYGSLNDPEVQIIYQTYRSR